MNYGITCITLALLLVCSCAKNNKHLNKYSDSTITSIADFQDHRLGDSLSAYLKDTNPVYRKEAALAFASIQDSAYVNILADVLMHDRDPAVRKVAAYALGQTPSRVSEQLLMEACGNERNKSVLAMIVEAYGKVARKWELTIALDDSVAASLAWSYYRMAVRGLSDTSMNRKAISLLRSTNTKTRLGAAHYFARGASDYGQFEKQLIRATRLDTSAEVRMAAVLGLRKIKTDSVRLAAERMVRSDQDYRVRINAVRVLQEFPFTATKNTLLEALNDSILNVAVASSETIKNSITPDYEREVAQIAARCKDWRVQANLYEAALSIAAHTDIVEEVKALFLQSRNAYQKAALITALQPAITSFRFVRDQLLSNSEPVIKVSAASAVVHMNYLNNLDPERKSEFARLYQDAIKNGDVAVIGIVSDALVDSSLHYKDVISDYSFLKDARDHLSLPKDFEAILPLEKAIAYFEGRTIMDPLKNEFNHPVPWKTVKKIPTDQQALIRTSKGNITIRLLIEEAPGSVDNFVTLALNKYYDGKFFHRVAPNFVIQAGCPRGDGWGSEAYSIRSEFSPRRYETGSVGMASAGKDTEGTQWFITHSPTPHLEGRYTLFAVVESGMDVVHKIGVGDYIIAVDIIDLKSL